MKRTMFQGLRLVKFAKFTAGPGPDLTICDGGSPLWLQVIGRGQRRTTMWPPFGYPR